MVPMKASLIIGVPKSGTTAAYSKSVAASSSARISFLEPPENDHNRVARVMRASVVDVVVKVVLSGNKEPTVLLNSASEVMATVRDPRDVVVSWLPFRAIANLRNASQVDLRADLIDIFERKAAGDDSVDITAVEQVYARHGVAVLSPDAYARSFDQLIDILGRYDCAVLKFEEVFSGGIQLARDDADISINFRSGRSGEWKKWFSRRDKERYEQAFERSIRYFGYEDWSNGFEGDRILRSEYVDYLISAADKRQNLKDSTEEWAAKYAPSARRLFGPIKPQAAYADAEYSRKLLERSSAGNVGAIIEVFEAYKLGYLAPSDEVISAVKVAPLLTTG